MRRLLAGITAFIAVSTLGSRAQTVESISNTDIDGQHTWFIELSSPPGVDGTSNQALVAEENAFHAAARAAGVQYHERRHFRTLFNGLAIDASNVTTRTIGALPGVRAVYPVVTVNLEPEDGSPLTGTDLITALRQTGADVAHSELGLTGRGVNVAVIDTGIDYDHPDLGGCFGPGCRVEKGFDFVGDDYDAADPATSIAPDPFPDDCNGHGTHVAGIIGANGGITGVAPDVTFSAYRVFGCKGSTTSDIILQALERALDDHVDIVNMSLGAALQWPQYPTAKAADRLTRHGIVVVASAGNESALGLYGSSAPAIGRNVISVASFENTHANLDAFSISPDDRLVGYVTSDSAPPPKTGSFPIARTGTTTSVADGCNALPAGSLQGDVALIRRGTCSFYQKAFNAQTAGAASVVLYNNVPGFLSPTVAGAPLVTIPVVMITAAQGAEIDARLAAGPVTMTWTDHVASEPNPTADQISSFSSYGPAPDLSLKPDIGAPGGSVRSTLPLEQGSYGVLSGTSMASPHVAGAVALLLEAKPHIGPNEVQQRLQNSAQPHAFAANPALGLESVHRQGAGMLRIDDAIEAAVVVSPGSLALGEVGSASSTQWLKLRLLDRHRHRHRRDEDGDGPVTYTVGHQPAVATGANTFTPQILASFATVEFTTSAVTVGGHGRSRDDDGLVGVTITPPPRQSGARLFGGYITFTPDDGSAVARVPYIGYNGDYQEIQVLTLTGFPALAKLTPGGFVLQPNGALFTMQGTDLPYFLLHLNHQVANLKFEVVDVATDRSLNFADDENFVSRNSTAGSLFLFGWDGTTMRRPGGKVRTVPNGTYRLELSVLKALGDPRNPDHYERWSSPNVTIARPSP